MVRVLLTPGWADEEHVHVWVHRPSGLDPDLCSSTAARVEIADQRRKIAGEWMLAVCSTNDSIQDSRRLLPFPAVVAEVVFEPVRVLLVIIFTFVPPCLAIIRNPENTATSQFYRDDKVFLEDRDDLVFVAFRVLEGESIVVVHHDGGDSHAPDFEHGRVDDIGKGGLGIVGNGFAEGGVVRATTEEPTASAH